MKKYSLIRQLSNNDCGCACVSMMLRTIYNVSIPISEIQQIVGMSENGCTFIGIKKGLESLGITGDVMKFSNEISTLKEFSKWPLLTQIHIDGKKHFVVLYYMKKDYLLIGDPLKPKLTKMKVTDFKRIWVPYVFFINRTGDPELLESYRNEKTLRIFSGILPLVRKKLIISWFILIVTYLLSVFATSIYTLFFDAVIPMKMLQLIPYISFIFIVVFFAELIMSYLYTKLSIQLNNQVDLNISDLFLTKLFAKNYSSLERIEDGEVLTCLKSISKMRENYLYWILNFPVDICKIILTFIILADKNKVLALLTALPIILSVSLTVLTKENLRAKSISLYNESESYNISLIQTLNNIDTIKRFSITNYYKNILVKKYEQLQKMSEKFVLFSTILNGLRESILSLFSLCILALGAYYVIYGELGSGSLLVFNSLSMKIINPFFNMSNMQILYEQGKIAELKLSNIMYLHNKKNGDILLEKIEEIKLDNISYSYNKENLVLEHLCNTFQCNKTYAIMGKSGAGKTTLGKIIASSYEIPNGQLICNGLPVDAYSNYCSKVTYVKQNVDIFSDSILNNILLGRDISFEIVQEKARKIGFDKIVETLPYGYNTLIGENGFRLSLGQMQLLNILRSTLQDYEIVIFDEVTSGLDNNLTELVRKYLFDYGNIKLFITHDVTFAKLCDEILILNDGHLQNYNGGNHEENNNC